MVDALKLTKPPLPRVIGERQTALSHAAELALTVEGGRLTDVDRARTAQASVALGPPATVDDHPTLARFLFEVRRSGPSAHPPFALSEAGLSWYSRPTYDACVPIITGDDPWDFCLFYALRRLRGTAYWLPTQHANEAAWLQGILMLPLRLQLGQDAVLCVSSTSDMGRTEAVAEALNQFAIGEGSARAIDWTELVPAEPNRLLVHESFSAPTTLAIEGSRSALFRSPAPSVRTQLDPLDMYWMTDVTVEGWGTVNSPSLGPALLADQLYGTELVRPSREGLSYLCPMPFVTSGRSLDAQTPTLRLRPLGLHDQLRAILEPAGRGLRASDKGIYTTQSGELFGGLLRLADTISQPQWRKLLGLLTSKKNVPPGRYQRSDQRRYFSLNELKAAIASAELESTPAQLVSQDIVWRGLRHRCDRCRWVGWYPQDELGTAIRCPRCRLQFPEHAIRWEGDEEPCWSYRLNEVLWQFIGARSDLSLRASSTFLYANRPTSLLSPEIELVGPDGQAELEIDLCVLRGQALWLGEAKAASTLGSETNARRQLRKIQRAADLLRADGILLVSGADQGFSPETRALISEYLDTLDAVVRVEILA